MYLYLQFFLFFLQTSFSYPTGFVVTFRLDSSSSWSAKELDTRYIEL